MARSSANATRKIDTPSPLRSESRSAPSPSGPAFQTELCSELAELPGRIRHLVSVHAGLSDELLHVAAGIAGMVGELGAHASSEELQRVPTQVEAYVERASRTLGSLLVFAGEIRGLAWTVGAMEWAEELAEPKE